MCFVERLTPWSRDLLETLVKKPPAYYGNWRFIPHSNACYMHCPYHPP
jgi:hypothetical protein